MQPSCWPTPVVGPTQAIMSHHFERCDLLDCKHLISMGAVERAVLDAYSTSKEDKGLLRYVRRYLLPLSWCIFIPMPTHDVTLHVSTSWCAHMLLIGPACQLAYCTAIHADKIFPHPVCRRLRVFAFQYAVTVGTSVMLTGQWLQAPHVLKCGYCTTVWRSHISVHLSAPKLFGRVGLDVLMHRAEEAICVNILLLGLLFSLGYGIFMQICGATSFLRSILEWRC